MQLRNTCASVICLVVLGALPSGCNRQSGPDLNAEVARLNAELETTKQKLSATEKSLEGQKDGLTLATNTAEAGKKQLAEKDKAIAQKDAQISALEREMADLKNRDAFVYADISGVQQKGLASIALGRYQQFVKDFPNSPLIVDANRAIAELSVTSDRDARWRASLIDPKKQEREALKHFADGIASAEELAPVLKQRSPADVVRLLGRPNRSFRNGTEYGYVDKVIDSATGERGTLVITFEADRVSGLRVGYQGREIKP